MRKDNRAYNELREVSLEAGFNPYAEGSCLVKFGNTHLICNATVDENVPYFLRNKGSGWVTAEYGMLPRSTHSRMNRESASKGPSGRTQEIQRLIGRSLRSVVDMGLLGERQIILDCDVIQADGGTRTAAITGAYVALNLACKTLMSKGLIRKSPIISEIAAVSCGIYKGKPILDLDYSEDSNAEVDSNFVMTGAGKLVEIQATAEKNSYSEEELLEMMRLAKGGIAELIGLQREITSL